ncbi:glycosyltransferase family 4 protein [Halobacteriovorax sp. ZH5_bin.2]|uniref:glycosyltransferase family 4 protein n=1 Tax=Halobacteriovorax sp. ZH5_bin.2 TaxID=3157727 RepID=UPI00371CAB2E
MSNVIALCATDMWYLRNFRLKLIQVLQDEYDQVVLIAGYDGNEKFLSEISKKVIVVNSNLDRKSTGIFNNLVLINKYRNIFNKYNPTRVINFTIKPNVFSGFVCWLQGREFINNVTGLGTAFLSSKLLQFVVLFMFKFIFPKAKYIVFQNSDDMDLISRYLQPSNFRLIEGSGIDPEFFIPIKEYNQREYDFVFIGRLIKDKGVREFLEASEKILLEYPDLNINVVGDIDLNNSSSLSEEEFLNYSNNTSIHMMGFSNFVKNILENTKCVVLPSYREGLSRVLLEAASMECFLIASNVPGCTQVLSNENGLLCVARDSDSLYEKMKEYIQMNLDEQESYAKRGRVLVKNRFSVSSVNSNLIALLKS